MSETPLPPLYARWVEHLLGTTIPAEPKATCSDCAMCDGRADDLPSEMRFRPDAKCCTYHPQLANFQVGLILDDASPEAAPGRAAIARQVRDRLGATPFGISPSPSFADEYERAKPEGRFGRDTSLNCPYFIAADGGSCTIWRHRNSVCSTYFCKPVRGAAGSAFWRTVLRLLQTVETELSVWCISELGLATEQLLDDKGRPRKLGDGALRGYVDATSGQLSPHLARQIWAGWHGREQDFYRACAALVAGLEWPDIKAKASVQLSILEARVRGAFAAAHSDATPAILCKTNFEIEPVTDGLVRLRSPASPYQPLRVDEAVADALVEFDGRPTRDVVQAARARGVELDATLLRTLFERGLVAAPDGNDVPRSLQPDHPLRPEDALGFFRGFTDEDVSLHARDEGDAPAKLILRCGAKELEFDEPELFDFARNLVKHQNGFLAGDATRWGPAALPWPRVAELLTAMLEEDVLQRFP
jgi:hypothetical protein